MPSPSSQLNSFLPNFSASSAFSVSTPPAPAVHSSILNLLTVPIIIPAEFCHRYIEFSNGRSGALTIPGQLVAMLLAVWAASFGVDEHGIDESQGRECLPLRDRKQLVDEMVRELLILFDIHGVMRKPSWDGVRALLLFLPLTEGRLCFPVVK